MRLKDKVAIVAGAGSIEPGMGNGKATAILFAREGAKVVTADKNLDAATETVEIIRGEGGETLAVQADVTQESDAKNLVELGERRPEIVKKIRALLEVGYTPYLVGKAIRRDNPQMWVESKFAESAARALKIEGE